MNEPKNNIPWTTKLEEREELMERCIDYERLVDDLYAWGRQNADDANKVEELWSTVDSLRSDVEEITAERDRLDHDRVRANDYVETLESRCEELESKCNSLEKDLLEMMRGDNGGQD